MQASIFIRFPDQQPELLITETKDIIARTGTTRVPSVYASGPINLSIFSDILALLPLSQEAEITVEGPFFDCDVATRFVVPASVSPPRGKNLAIDCHVNEHFDCKILQTLSAPHISIYEDAHPDFIDVWKKACKILTQRDYQRYDLYHFAQAGYESRHQQGLLNFDNYLGVGPDAHGRFLKDGFYYATETYANASRWAVRVQDQGNGLQHMVALTTPEILAQALSLGLHRTEGFNQSLCHKAIGKSIEAALPQDRLEALYNEGLLVFNDNTLKPTLEGLFKITSMVEFLLKD